MSDLYRTRQNFRDLSSQIGYKRGSGQFPSQRAAFNQFKRDKWQTVLVPDFVDLHDIWMLQSGDGLCFYSKTAYMVFVRKLTEHDCFQGYLEIQSYRPTSIDNSHAC